MGWDLSRQTHNVEIWKVKNSNAFLNSQQAALMVFSGPYLTRRVALPKQE
jgi:hypothetical protein